MAGLNSTTPQTRQDRTIYRAIKILESRFKSESISLNNPDKVRDYLRLLLASEEREVFVVLYLDAQNRLIESEVLFYGTLMQTSVYPREVIKGAIKHNAAAVVFAHNHPTGVVKQSLADECVTKDLKKALDMIDVKVFDHFIVAGKYILSFAEKGLI